MHWKGCEKALRCPEMVSNSPSLSGSNEGRQQRLRRKEYITLVQKIWLFLSLCGRRHREKCGRNQGNVDMGFGSFSRLSRSKLCHSTTKPMACFCYQVTRLSFSLLLFHPRMYFSSNTTFYSHWKKNMKAQHWLRMTSTNGKAGLKCFN